ncbi:hypothetical protein AB6878_04805 [Carnobacterium maltaromaticum]|uniref:hypothetical protein n=1 Tax=Carnobacterium maltaromaticum TaxID=2751 RepID=UPI0039BDCE88
MNELWPFNDSFSIDNSDSEGYATILLTLLIVNVSSTMLLIPKLIRFMLSPLFQINYITN